MNYFIFILIFSILIYKFSFFYLSISFFIYILIGFLLLKNKCKNIYNKPNDLLVYLQAMFFWPFLLDELF
jgi:hypothetical protein